MWAVKVKGYTVWLPGLGVPERTPVEGSNLTPVGKFPVKASVGAGIPVSATVKVEAVPMGKVALPALVMAGGTACWPPLPAQAG